MAVEVRRLVALLGFRTDKASVTRAQKAIQNIKRGVTLLAGALVTGRVARGLNDIVRETAALGDSVDKVSQKLGINAQALQELRFAAEQTGVGQQTLDLALQRFTRRAAEAARGTGEAKDALAQMGVQLRDSNGQLRPTEDLLGEVADAMQRTTNDGDRLRLAFKLFDSEGAALVNTLKNGSSGLDQLRAKARSTGGVLDAGLIRQSVRLTDTMSEARLTVQGVRNTVAKNLIPTFVKATRGIIRFVKENRVMIRQRVNETLDRITGTLGRLGRFFLDAGSAAGKWFDELDPVIQSLIKIAALIAAVAVVLLLPAGGFLVMLALVGLLIDDFQTWREGGDSLIGRFLEGFGDMTGALEVVKEAVDVVADSFGFMGETAVQLLEDATDRTTVLGQTVRLLGITIAIVGVRWAVVNKAMIAGWILQRAVALKTFAITKAAAIADAAITAAAYAGAFIFIIAEYIAAGAAAVASGAVAAAAWLAATLPLIITIGLLALLGLGILAVIEDLNALGSGQESVIGTMITGIDGLIAEWGGVGPAIGAMLDEALRFWLQFFGLTKDETDNFVDDLTDTLQNFWANVIDFWGGLFDEFVEGLLGTFGEIGRSIGETLGLIDEDEGQSEQGEPIDKEGIARRRRAELAAGDGPDDAPPFLRRPPGPGPSPIQNIARAATNFATGPAAGFASLPAQAPVQSLASIAPSTAAGVGRTGPTISQKIDTQFDMTVQAAPGMSEERVATIASEQAAAAFDDVIQQSIEDYNTGAAE